jgi:hypothetical protein
MLILSSASSRVKVNGVFRKNFKHHRGLRHIDLLSPMLFIIAVGPLKRLLDHAEECGLL